MHYTIYNLDPKKHVRQKIILLTKKQFYKDKLVKRLE